MMMPSNRFELINDCIRNAIEESEKECEDLFKKSYSLSKKDSYKLNQSIKSCFDALRDIFEDECYHGKNGGNHSLDYRKASAILCNSLVCNKAFFFDEVPAMEYICGLEQKIDTHGNERKDFNRYLVNTIFINYKVAYLAALHLLYFFIMFEFVDKKCKNKNGQEMWKGLANRKNLVTYKSLPAEDSFDVNMIMGLARADMERKDVDLYFLSLHFYQIEMYTRLALETDSDI